MELWIRSQDKLTLMKTTYVYVAREVVCAYDENKCWSTIGVYKSQERALEVLDKIEAYIKLKYLYEAKEYDAIKTIINGVDEVKASNNMIVYQMPEN